MRRTACFPGWERRAVASNRIAGPIEVQLNFVSQENIGAEPPLPLRTVVPADSERTLATLRVLEDGKAANFALDFTQAQPGLVEVTAQNDFASGAATVFKRGDTGYLIKAGSVFALLMNGTGLPNPFFTIGAFVQ